MVALEWHVDGYTIAGEPDDEVKRLQVLQDLSTDFVTKEKEFDIITKAAACIFKVENSVITFVDKDKVWIKSRYGTITDKYFQKNISVCGHAVRLNESPMILEDTTKDKRFKNNPLLNRLQIRFYAACAIKDPKTGCILGNLCIIDSKPRSIDKKEIEILETLSKQVQVNLQLQTELAKNINLMEQLKEQQEKIKQGREETERISKVKTNFIATMSHEIRTPINAIIGMSDLLDQTTLTNQQKEFSEVITNSSRALLQLVNNILDVSKIEHGKFCLEYRKFSLIDCVEASVNQVFHLASEKKLDFGYMIDPSIDCENVLGDSTRVQQILVNLLSNAVKFTKEGEVELNIQRICLEEFQSLTKALNNSPQNVILKSHRILQPSAYDNTREIPLYMHITVRDTGIGIKPEQLEKIFEAYHQAETTTTRDYGGTGLGLALCLQIAKMMNGTAWVTSEYGNGSCFHVALEMKYLHTRKNTKTCLRKSSLSNIIEDISSASGTKEECLVRNNHSIALTITKGFVTSNMISNILQRNNVFTKCARSLDVALSLLKMYTVPFKVCFIEATILESSANPGLFLQRMRELSPSTFFVLLYLPQQIELRNECIDHVNVTMLQCLSFSSISRLLSQIVKRRKSCSVFSKFPSKGKSTQNSKANKGKLSLLLVEDNRSNILVMTKMLSHLDVVDVDVAENGKIAVERVFARHYDIVLMDTRMPVMNGLEATKLIRQNSKIKQPFIVSISAGAFQNEIEKTLSSGMDAYLIKPISLNAIESLLRDHMLCSPRITCRSLRF